MNDRSTRQLWLISVLCLSLTQACGAGSSATAASPTSPSNLDAVPASSSPSPRMIVTPAKSTPAPNVEASPAEGVTVLAAKSTPAPNVEASQAEGVTVLAAKGNMFIRRGPDLAFNPIAVLRQGESANARARDVLGRWLEIYPAADSATGGWISIMSEFTVVRGDVRLLPEVMPTEWPDPASLRNCTRHEMVAEPGGIQIPSVFNFPYNDVRLNPGTYTIHDADVDLYPEVLTVELREGSAIDIRVDGDGLKRKCPLP